MNIKKNKKTKTRIFISAVILIAILVSLSELTGLTHIFHNQPAATTGSSYTKGEQQSSTSSQSPTTPSSNTTSTQPGDQKSDTGTSFSQLTLITPSGDFVSNHHPNLSGSPAPNSLTSVCSTTPGGSCDIVFTKDGVTKSLGRQTTDRGGSTYWDWKLQDKGLTAGTWKVTAVATYNGKTASASDALDLVVAQ